MVLEIRASVDGEPCPFPDENGGNVLRRPLAACACSELWLGVNESGVDCRLRAWGWVMTDGGHSV